MMGSDSDSQNAQNPERLTPRIFVSHSHIDNGMTVRLVDDLRAAGATVWVDVADLEHGDFVERINQALVDCDWFVLVQSPHSLSSKPVRQEVNAALRLMWHSRIKDVIPFVVAPCDEDEIPAIWGTLHHYDATSNYEAALAGLLRAVGLQMRAMAEQNDQIGGISESNITRNNTGARIFACANQSGRIGKTETSVNLAAFIADNRQRVLLVDLSPNMGATMHLGVDPETVHHSVYDMLLADSIDIDAVVRQVRTNIWLLPASAQLWTADQQLPYVKYPEYRLAQGLDRIRNSFDFILIDCPSWLGLLTINALVACDGAIIPLPCHYFDLEGLKELLKMVYVVRNRHNLSLFLFGIVQTMYEIENQYAKQAVEEIGEHFRNEKFATLIPRDIQLLEASTYGRTILEHNPRSPGAIAYKALAAEVVARTANIVSRHS